MAHYARRMFGLVAVTTEGIENDLARILLANAEKTEQQDRPTTESLQALRRHGAFALKTPERFGGPWANTTTIVGHLLKLGRYCPSTSWIVGTCATAKNFAADAFGDAVPGEFFADPDALACGTGMPGGGGERTPDGIRVNGRWPYVSGCEDSTWAGLAVIVDGAYTFAVIPVTDLTIERTWNVAGMRGTGSHTLVAENVLVPAERAAAAAPPAPATLVSYGTLVLAPVVGAARGALDVINGLFASDYRPSMTGYTRMGESPAARQLLAEATLLVDRAERTLLAAAQAADAGDVSQADSARLHLDMPDAARDCRTAVELMLDLHGAGGFAMTDPLQRYWRDIAVASRHRHLRPYTAVENYGRLLAGHD